MDGCGRNRVGVGSRPRVRGAGLLAALLLSACARPPAAVPSAAAIPSPPPPEVYRRADDDRVKALEREQERLREDLRAAEEALVAIESGMRGSLTRAQAVSGLAEARIQVDRAAQRSPWRAATLVEARAKLDEAERQLAQGHIGSTIFFVSRASRIAATLLAEASQVEKNPATRFVRAGRVNLRSAPTLESPVVAVLPAGLPVFPESEHAGWMLVRTASGDVGWVHAPLLRGR
jgi:hypothetical protein